MASLIVYTVLPCTSDFHCPEGITLQGNDVICPGEVGLFECRVDNGFDVRWTVDSEDLIIVGSDEIGTICRSSSVPNAIALLLERNLTNPLEQLGSRTSILRYRPNPK